MSNLNKGLKYVSLFSVLVFNSTLAFGSCFERFYDQAHLAKHPQQVVKNIVMQIVENYSDNAETADVKLQIQMMDAEKNPVLGLATGKCNYKSESNRTEAECAIQAPGKGTFSMKGNGQYSYDVENFTVRLSSDSVLENVTWGASSRTVVVPKYDHSMRVDQNKMVSYVKGDCEPVMFNAHATSISRLWNEMILYSIRNDIARPTVTARNLYHLSALLWDVYSAYENKKALMLEASAPAFSNLELSRNIAMSYAGYTFLMERYKNAPINTGDQFAEVNDPAEMIVGGEGGDGTPDRFLDQTYNRLIKKLDFDVVKNKAHVNFGIEFAKRYLDLNLTDGSREAEGYKPAPGYVLKNPVVADVSQSGLRGLMTKTADELISDFFKFMDEVSSAVAEGQDFDYESLPALFNTESYRGPVIAGQVDINHWVRLNIPGAIDQGGTAVASEQSPLTLFWGFVKTFSNLKPFESADKPGVYFDPGQSLPKFETDPDQVIRANAQVVEFSSKLNPLDMSAYDFDQDGNPDKNPGADLMDISPVSLGNNPLGSNDGKGRQINPVTGRPYQQNLVKVANYYRSIAEFWADGPESETPPGHWNSIANYVLDQMEQSKIPRKWKGQGEELSPLEYELRLYLTLNGALHDAAIAAWGIKGHYQGNRPVSVIRKLADMAEKDPAFAAKLTSMSPNFKMVTYEKSEKDQNGNIIKKMVSKLAVKAWRGPKIGKYYEVDFVGPELRDLSFRFRNDIAKEEDRFFIENSIAGVGWMLADNWVPYQRQTFVTPPFPGFVSGHSTFSRAAAEVLTGVTGTEYFPGGLGKYKAPSLHFEFSEETPFEFHWATYFDAADVSGLSRIYGGIHATYDDLPARRVGSRVGQEALKTADKIFN